MRLIDKETYFVDMLRRAAIKKNHARKIKICDSLFKFEVGNLSIPINRIFCDDVFLDSTKFSLECWCFLCQNRLEFAEILRRIDSLAFKDSMIEIGFYHGASYMVWSEIFSKVCSIDNNMFSFLNHMHVFPVVESSLFVVGDSGSKSVLSEVKEQFCNSDFLFIDGAHDFESVRRDYFMYAPLIRDGGLICFHDALGDWDVANFINRLNSGSEQDRNRHSIEVFGATSEPLWHNLGVGFETMTPAIRKGILEHYV